jgi:hypothetical protein
MENKTLEDCIRQIEFLFGINKEETIKTYNKFYSEIIDSYDEDDDFTGKEIMNKAIEKTYKYYEREYD